MINSTSIADLDVSDVLFAGSLFNILNAEPSSDGTLHKYPKLVTAPTVNFRDPGVGAANTPPVRELVEASLKYLDASAKEDAAIADAYKDGHEAYMAKASLLNLRAGYSTAEKQFFYGKQGAATGLPGLVELEPFQFANSSRVIDGGASGNVESVWVIRTGEDDLSAVYNKAQPLEIGDVVETMVSTYKEGKIDGEVLGYAAKCATWVGIQIGSLLSAVRIANLDPAGGDAEDKIEDALDMFAEDRQATHVIMSRKMRGNIRRGRTGFSSSGRASKPLEIGDVPIQISEALVTETALPSASPTP